MRGALQVNGKTVAEVSDFIGIATNNVAEYTGLVKILERAQALGYKQVEVRMDSELVVKQMLGAYRVKNEGLIPLFTRAKALSMRFLTFKIVHVRREANKEADRLANLAMDQGLRQSTGP